MASADKSFKWQESKLKAAVAKSIDYNHKDLHWQCRTGLAKHAKITEIERRNAVFSVIVLDLCCPCTEIEKAEALGVHLQSSTQVWAEARGRPMRSVFQVF